MSNLNEQNSQLSAITDAMDRVTDKIADVTDDALVKATLIRQFEELKRQKSIIESKIKILEQSKVI
jgi:hypothetical protein